jgi:DNA-binding protein H-NS
MAAVKRIDLSQLSDPHLLELSKRVEVEIATRRAAARRLAADRGRLLEDEAPRYRNPENPTETWSGRGPEPEWVLLALARGETLDDLRSIDDRPVRQPRRR